MFQIVTLATFNYVPFALPVYGGEAVESQETRLMPETPYQETAAVSGEVSQKKRSTDSIEHLMDDRPLLVNDSFESPSKTEHDERNYEYDRYDFEDALDLMRPEYASAVVLKNIGSEDLKKLAELSFEVGIAVLHGEIVLFTSGSEDEIGVLPAVKALTDKADLVSHTHPYGGGPSSADLSEAQALGKQEYVVTRQGVYAYGPDGMLNNGEPMVYEQYLARVREALEASSETQNQVEARKDLNQFIAEQDRYNESSAAEKEIFRMGGTITPRGSSSLSALRMPGNPYPSIMVGSSEATLASVSSSNSTLYTLHYDTRTRNDFSGFTMSFDSPSTAALETQNISGIYSLIFQLRGNAPRATIEVVDINNVKDSFQLVGVNQYMEQSYTLRTATLSNNLDKSKIKAINIVVKNTDIAGTGSLFIRTVGVRNFNYNPADPVITSSVPATTTAATMTVSGTKPAATSIFINDQEVVPSNNSGTWTATVNVTEGHNSFTVKARNSAGLFSTGKTFTLDRLPERSIIINGGNAYATSPNVTLALSGGTTDISTMSFSMDNIHWSTPEPFSPSKSFTLTGQDGTKTVYVKYFNQTGNEIVAGSASVILDTVVPTGTISRATTPGFPATPYTTSRNISLVLNASDAGSGIDKVSFSTDNVTWSEPMAYSESVRFLLPEGDGMKMICAKFYDKAGNVSQTVATGVTLDTLAPTGMIMINGYETMTSDRRVTLNFSASDRGSGVSYMMFSPDGVHWTRQDFYSRSKTYSLSGGDGTKTVYVKFVDRVGRISPVFSASIILDTIPPTGSLLINSGAAYSETENVNLSLSAIDHGTGLATMSFSTNNQDWSPQIPYMESHSLNLPTGDGAKTVYVKFYDRTGNASQTYSQSIILDTRPPEGTINVNGGNLFIKDPNVTLHLDAVDAGTGMNQMRFSTDGRSWSIPEAYATTKTWNFSPAQGNKTVYVQFSDQRGLWSVPVSVTVLLDTVAPQGTLTINSNAAYAVSRRLSLNLSASEAGSGTDTMSFSTDGIQWTSPQAYTASPVFEVPEGDGVKTVHVKFWDRAGNVSPVYSKSITLDTVPPEGSISVNNDATYVGRPEIVFHISASDSLSGVSEMSFSTDNQTWSMPEAFSTEKTRTFPSPGYLLYVKFRDRAGNWSDPVSVRGAQDEMKFRAEMLGLDTNAPLTYASVLATEAAEKNLAIPGDGSANPFNLNYFSIQTFQNAFQTFQNLMPGQFAASIVRTITHEDLLALVRDLSMEVAVVSLPGFSLLFTSGHRSGINIPEMAKAVLQKLLDLSSLVFHTHIDPDNSRNHAADVSLRNTFKLANGTAEYVLRYDALARKIQVDEFDQSGDVEDDEALNEDQIVTRLSTISAQTATQPGMDAASRFVGLSEKFNVNEDSLTRFRSEGGGGDWSFDSFFNFDFDISSWLGSAWDSLSAAFYGFFADPMASINYWMQSIGEGMSSLISSAADYLNQGIEWMSNYLSSSYESLFQGMENYFGNVWGELSSHMPDIEMEDFNLLSGISTFVQDLIAPENNMPNLDLANVLASGLTSIFDSITPRLDTDGLAVDQFQQYLNSQNRSSPPTADNFRGVLVERGFFEASDDAFWSDLLANARSGWLEAHPDAAAVARNSTFDDLVSMSDDELVAFGVLAAQTYEESSAGVFNQWMDDYETRDQNREQAFEETYRELLGFKKIALSEVLLNQEAYADQSFRSKFGFSLMDSISRLFTGSSYLEDSLPVFSKYETNMEYVSDVDGYLMQLKSARTGIAGEEDLAVLNTVRRNFGLPELNENYVAEQSGTYNLATMQSRLTQSADLGTYNENLNTNYELTNSTLWTIGGLATMTSGLINRALGTGVKVAAQQAAGQAITQTAANATAQSAVALFSMQGLKEIGKRMLQGAVGALPWGLGIGGTGLNMVEYAEGNISLGQYLGSTALGTLMICGLGAGIGGLTLPLAALFNSLAHPSQIFKSVSQKVAPFFEGFNNLVTQKVAPLLERINSKFATVSSGVRSSLTIPKSIERVSVPETTGLAAMTADDLGRLGIRLDAEGRVSIGELPSTAEHLGGGAFGDAWRITLDQPIEIQGRQVRDFVVKAAREIEGTGFYPPLNMDAKALDLANRAGIDSVPLGLGKIVDPITGDTTATITAYVEGVSMDVYVRQHPEAIPELRAQVLEIRNQFRTADPAMNLWDLKADNFGVQVGSDGRLTVKLRDPGSFLESANPSFENDVQLMFNGILSRERVLPVEPAQTTIQEPVLNRSQLQQLGVEIDATTGKIRLPPDAKKFSDGKLGDVYLIEGKGVEINGKRVEQIVIKIAKPGYEGALVRDRQALKIGYEIGSKSIPEYYGAITQGMDGTGQLYAVAMEYIPGSSLSDVAKGIMRLSGPEAMNAAMSRYEGQILEIINTFSQHGLTCRDTNPANVIIHPERGLIMIDPGSFFPADAAYTKTNQQLAREFSNWIQLTNNPVLSLPADTPALSVKDRLPDVALMRALGDAEFRWKFDQYMKSPQDGPGAWKPYDDPLYTRTLTNLLKNNGADVNTGELEVARSFILRAMMGNISDLIKATPVTGLSLGVALALPLAQANGGPLNGIARLELSEETPELIQVNYENVAGRQKTEWYSLDNPTLVRRVETLTENNQEVEIETLFQRELPTTSTRREYQITTEQPRQLSRVYSQTYSAEGIVASVTESLFQQGSKARESFREYERYLPEMNGEGLLKYAYDLDYTESGSVLTKNQYWYESGERTRRVLETFSMTPNPADQTRPILTLLETQSEDYAAQRSALAREAFQQRIGSSLEGIAGIRFTPGSERQEVEVKRNSFLTEVYDLTSGTLTRRETLQTETGGQEIKITDIYEGSVKVRTERREYSSHTLAQSDTPAKEEVITYGTGGIVLMSDVSEYTDGRRTSRWVKTFDTSGALTALSQYAYDTTGRMRGLHEYRYQNNLRVSRQDKVYDSAGRLQHESETLFTAAGALRQTTQSWYENAIQVNRTVTIYQTDGSTVASTVSENSAAQSLAAIAVTPPEGSDVRFVTGDSNLVKVTDVSGNQELYDLEERQRIYRTEYVKDAQGEVLSQNSIIYSSGVRTEEIMTVYESGRDEDGNRRTSLTRVREYDGNNLLSRETETRYEQGRVVSESTTEYEDGELIQKTNEQYDRTSGDLLSRREELYDDDGALSRINEDRYVYQEEKRIEEYHGLFGPETDAAGRPLPAFEVDTLYYLSGNVQKVTTDQYDAGIKTRHHELEYEDQLNSQGTSVVRRKYAEGYDERGLLKWKSHIAFSGGRETTWDFDEYRPENDAEGHPVVANHIHEDYTTLTDGAPQDARSVYKRNTGRDIPAGGSIDYFDETKLFVKVTQASGIEEIYNIDWGELFQRTEYDRAADGTISSRRDTYYSNGVLTEENMRVYGSHGKLDRQSIKKYSSDGQLVSEEEMIYLNGKRSRYEYKEYGARLDAAGRLVLKTQYNSTFHSGGNLATEEGSQYEAGVKRSDYRRDYEPALDENGMPVKMTSLECTYRADASMSTRRSTRYTDGNTSDILFQEFAAILNADGERPITRETHQTPTVKTRDEARTALAAFVTEPIDPSAQVRSGGGNIVKVINAAGNTTQIYDIEKRQRTGRVHYTYHPNGNLESRIEEKFESGRLISRGVMQFAVETDESGDPQVVSVLKETYDASAVLVGKTYEVYDKGQKLRDESEWFEPPVTAAGVSESGKTVRTYQTDGDLQTEETFLYENNQVVGQLRKNYGPRGEFVSSVETSPAAESDAASGAVISRNATMTVTEKDNRGRMIRCQTEVEEASATLDGKPSSRHESENVRYVHDAAVDPGTGALNVAAGEIFDSQGRPYTQISVRRTQAQYDNNAITVDETLTEVERRFVYWTQDDFDQDRISRAEIGQLRSMEKWTQSSSRSGVWTVTRLSDIRYDDQGRRRAWTQDVTDTFYGSGGAAGISQTNHILRMDTRYDAKGLTVAYLEKDSGGNLRQTNAITYDFRGRMTGYEVASALQTEKKTQITYYGLTNLEKSLREENSSEDPAVKNVTHEYNAQGVLLRSTERSQKTGASNVAIHYVKTTTVLERDQLGRVVRYQLDSQETSDTLDGRPSSLHTSEDVRYALDAAIDATSGSLSIMAGNAFDDHGKVRTKIVTKQTQAQYGGTLLQTDSTETTVYREIVYWTQADAANHLIEPFEVGQLRSVRTLTQLASQPGVWSDSQSSDIRYNFLGRRLMWNQVVTDRFYGTGPNAEFSQTRQIQRLETRYGPNGLPSGYSEAESDGTVRRMENLVYDFLGRVTAYDMVEAFQTIRRSQIQYFGLSSLEKSRHEVNTEEGPEDKLITSEYNSRGQLAKTIETLTKSYAGGAALQKVITNTVLERDILGRMVRYQLDTLETSANLDGKASNRHVIEDVRLVKDAAVTQATGEVNVVAGNAFDGAGSPRAKLTTRRTTSQYDGSVVSTDVSETEIMRQMVFWNSTDLSNHLISNHEVNLLKNVEVWTKSSDKPAVWSQRLLSNLRYDDHGRRLTWVQDGTDLYYKIAGQSYFRTGNWYDANDNPKNWTLERYTGATVLLHTIADEHTVRSSTQYDSHGRVSGYRETRGGVLTELSNVTYDAAGRISSYESVSGTDQLQRSQTLYYGLSGLVKSCHETSQQRDSEGTTHSTVKDVVNQYDSLGRRFSYNESVTADGTSYQTSATWNNNLVDGWGMSVWRVSQSPITKTESRRELVGNWNDQTLAYNRGVNHYAQIRTTVNYQTVAYQAVYLFKPYSETMSTQYTAQYTEYVSGSVTAVADTWNTEGYWWAGFVSVYEYDPGCDCTRYIPHSVTATLLKVVPAQITQTTSLQGSFRRTVVDKNGVLLPGFSAESDIFKPSTRTFNVREWLEDINYYNEQARINAWREEHGRAVQENYREWENQMRYQAVMMAGRINSLQLQNAVLMERFNLAVMQIQSASLYSRLYPSQSTFDTLSRTVLELGNLIDESWN